MASAIVKHGRTQDLAAWADETAEAIEFGRWEQIDRKDLAEELRELSRSQLKEVRNRLKVVIAHLLKYRAQPGRRCGSWQAGIIDQRGSILDFLDESPSLRHRLSAGHLVRIWNSAVTLASAETGLPRENFPAACPWDLYSEVLSEDWFPDS